MNADSVEFRRGVVAPLECIREGWELIREQYWPFLLVSFVGGTLGGVFPILLIGPMTVGIFLSLQKLQRDLPVDFWTLFKGFKWFVPSLVVSVLKMILTLIVIVIVLIPYYILLFRMMAVMIPNGQNPSPEESQQFLWLFIGFEIIFLLLVISVGLLMEIFFMLAYPLLADHRMSGMAAVKLSLRAGKANAGGILGLLMLNVLFGIVGLLCCIVGVCFYLPIAFASQAVAYRRIFPDTGTTSLSPTTGSNSCTLPNL